MLEEQAEKVKAIGGDDIWSSTNLYRHLQRLQTLAPMSVGNRRLLSRFRSHVGYTRMKWSLVLGSTPFSFVSAMVLPNERVVLTTKQPIPPTAIKPSSTITLHGTIDYIATAADRSVVGEVFVLSGCLLPD